MTNPSRNERTEDAKIAMNPAILGKCGGKPPAGRGSLKDIGGVESETARAAMRKLKPAAIISMAICRRPPTAFVSATDPVENLQNAGEVRRPRQPKEIAEAEQRSAPEDAKRRCLIDASWAAWSCRGK